MMGFSVSNQAWRCLYLHANGHAICWLHAAPNVHICLHEVFVSAALSELEDD